MRNGLVAFDSAALGLDYWVKTPEIGMATTARLGERWLAPQYTVEKFACRLQDLRQAGGHLRLKRRPRVRRVELQ